MKKILIIEDDMEIADVEKDYLELSGLSVTIRPGRLSGSTGQPLRPDTPGSDAPGHGWI